MIRKTTVEDVPSIYTLYQSFTLDVSRVNDGEYAARVEREGFLLALDTQRDIADRIQTNVLFNIFEEDGKIVGFVVCNKEIYFPEEAGNIIWFDEKLKDNYFHSNTAIALHEILIDKMHQRKGIATQILNDSLNSLRRDGFTDVYSIVTLGPVTNCPSIIFHTRNGFQRACITNPIDLFGLQNYQSLLFHRKI